MKYLKWLMLVLLIYIAYCVHIIKFEGSSIWDDSYKSMYQAEKDINRELKKEIREIKVLIERYKREKRGIK